MARSTLDRDYDIGRTLARLQAEIAELRRRVAQQPVASSIWQDVPGGFDTGWQPFTNLSAGVTAQGGANAPELRRYGPVVMARGRCSTAGISGAVTFGTMPTGFGFEPMAIWELGRGTPATVPTTRYVANPSGQLTAAGWVAGAVFALSGVWGVSLP